MKAMHSAAALPFPYVLQLGPYSPKAIRSEGNKQLKILKAKILGNANNVVYNKKV